ncbi:MAG: hypothetical protein ACI3VX_04405 [Faecousia sp.]|nr:hypothetical protein [Bacillota bacterium]MDY2719858.1 hypothetical protein [Candidatus Faecousia sp.]
MSINKLPTTADIYLEVNGVKVAVVQSYKVTAVSSSRVVEAFGEKEPVATIRGQNSYTIELTRLYATDVAIRDGISFHDLENFSLAVCKPDRSIIYYGCQWSALEESAEVGGMVLERAVICASHRVEAPN